MSWFETALWAYGITTVVAAGAVCDILPIRGERPITKALWCACFLPGVIPYPLGMLLVWAVRKPVRP